MSEQKLTYIGIKKDTTFPITVGGNTLINLQKLLLFLIADKSEEEIKIAQEKIMQQKYDEEWYEHVAFISFMINAMETEAHKLGLTVEEDLSDPNLEQN
jgi:hypothetical protein